MRMSMQAGAEGFELEIYDDIGMGWFSPGITAGGVAHKLDGQSLPVNVRINSYGGDVMEGLGIYNILKAYPGTVATYDMGFACSIAALIFMAGKERHMCGSSLLMVHEAWGGAQGNSTEMRKYADTLDIVTDSTISAFARESGTPEHEVRALFEAESWLNPGQALELGFATHIDEEAGSAAMAASGRSRAFELIHKGLAAERRRQEPPEPEGPEAPAKGRRQRIAEILEGRD
jgi:ATP-dependent Clp protease protease subunit